MFENDLYRRLVLKTQASNRKINTVKPWFPKQREKKEIKGNLLSYSTTR